MPSSSKQGRKDFTRTYAILHGACEVAIPLSQSHQLLAESLTFQAHSNNNNYTASSYQVKLLIVLFLEESTLKTASLKQHSLATGKFQTKKYHCQGQKIIDICLWIVVYCFYPFKTHYGHSGTPGHSDLPE